MPESKPVVWRLSANRLRHAFYGNDHFSLCKSIRRSATSIAAASKDECRRCKIILSRKKSPALERARRRALLPESETVNGFRIWPDRTCGHCGFTVDPDDPEPYAYRLECPDCYREGCDECMPCGRGCLCPECEDANVEEVGDG